MLLCIDCKCSSEGHFPNLIEHGTHLSVKYVMRLMLHRAHIQKCWAQIIGPATPRKNFSIINSKIHDILYYLAQQKVLPLKQNKNLGESVIHSFQARTPTDKAKWRVESIILKRKHQKIKVHNGNMEKKENILMNIPDIQMARKLFIKYILTIISF